jgi:hypothetical protein
MIESIEEINSIIRRNLKDNGITDPYKHAYNFVLNLKIGVGEKYINEHISICGYIHIFYTFPVRHVIDICYKKYKMKASKHIDNFLIIDMKNELRKNTLDSIING